MVLPSRAGEGHRDGLVSFPVDLRKGRGLWFAAPPLAGRMDGTVTGLGRIEGRSGCRLGLGRSGGRLGFGQNGSLLGRSVERSAMAGTASFWVAMERFLPPLYVSNDISLTRRARVAGNFAYLPSEKR